MGVWAKPGRDWRRGDEGIGEGRWGRRDKKQNWEPKLRLVTPLSRTVRFMDLNVPHASSLLKVLYYFPLMIESTPNLHQGTQGHSNLSPVFLLCSYHTLNYFHSWSHPVPSYTYLCLLLKFLFLSPFVHLANSESNITSFGKFSLKCTLLLALRKGNVHLSLMWAHYRQYACTQRTCLINEDIYEINEP